MYRFLRLDPENHGLAKFTHVSELAPGDSGAAPVDPVDPLAAKDLDPQTPLFLGDAIGDDTSTTTVLNIGSSMSSLIDAGGDKDFFRVTLTAGQAYHFTVDGLAPGALVDPYLEVRDASGAIVDEDDDGGAGTNSSTMFIAPTTGPYYLAVRAFGATQTGNYTVTAQAIPTGNTSPTQFPANGKPMYSWDQAALQLTRNGATWNLTTTGAPVVVTYAFRAN